MNRRLFFSRTKCVCSTSFYHSPYPTRLHVYAIVVETKRSKVRAMGREPIARRCVRLGEGSGGLGRIRLGGEDGSGKGGGGDGCGDDDWGGSSGGGDGDP